KLSEEFPHEHLTEECTEHPLLHCLRCVTASVRDYRKCSQCDVQVTEDNKQYKQYVQTLEFLFPTVAVGEVNTTGQCLSPTDESTSHIVITTLSGECISIVYNLDQTIIDVKDIVEKKLKTPCKKQCLLYNDTELEERDQDDEVLKLKDYHVQPNSNIYLLVLLYEVPDDYDDVIFDLFWGYPQSGKDFLDASVLLYSGSEFVEVVDFRCTLSQSGAAISHTQLRPAVVHSGDVMDEDNQLGHHTIKVSIKSIPDNISTLVFALSAWNAPNISKYPNPSLKFFDARCPNRQLCDDRMEDVAYSQAIIMCFLTKRGGKWRVVSVKRPSAGNAKDYELLQKTIVDLISKTV
ncbi:Ubiquitin-60S ribosomal L40, partial [Paramuricea clavata]